jgi:protein-tyrosine phosphatase
MIDIHCHILYGIDDGAQDLQESIEMARLASKDGIRHLFATPHFKWFIQRGTRPIIPHPERHYFFRKQPELLTRLIDEGCWTQVSVDSLLGKNSDDAMDFAHRLIDDDLVHILATDAHNLHRKPNLSDGFRMVTERSGSQKAKEIHSRAQQILEA